MRSEGWLSWFQAQHAPVAGAAQQWLTVVTTGATTGEHTRLSAADGNVTSGNLVGVELAAPQSQVVLFAADQAATGSVTSANATTTPNSQEDGARGSR